MRAQRELLSFGWAVALGASLSVMLLTAVVISAVLRVLGW